jgi:hypothetical protein
MPFKLDDNGQIDANNYSDRVASERETRNKLLSWARYFRYEQDMLILWAKFDKMLKNCTNEEERKDMAKLGWYETLKLMGSYGTFFMDGKLVYSKEDDQRFQSLEQATDKKVII